MKKTINSPGGKMKLIILRYGKGPGILWIHGGGYAMGMASMVYYSMGRMLAKRYGGVVISPEYRLAKKAPYPAALEDCYAALKYMYDYADELGIDRRRIIVGGESAGGGLAAAVCMYARDRGEVPVSFLCDPYTYLDSGLLAASFKNSQQVLELTKYGVKAVTVAPDVIDGLVKNAAIDAAISQFTADFQGLAGEGKTMADC